MGTRNGQLDRTPRGSRIQARVIGALFLLVGVALLFFGGRDFGYAARLAGTPGTFQVVDGVSVPGNGRSGPHMVWEGIFTSADGRTKDDAATLQDESDGHQFGTRIAVTRSGAGAYYTAQPNYVLGWLCIGFAGGSLAAFALPMVCFGRAFRRADRDMPRGVRVCLLIACGSGRCTIAFGAAALVTAAVA